MNTMGLSTSALSRALPSLLAAAVVSIVLGIVGMHALNTHGVMGTADNATMTSPMAGPMTGPMTGAHAHMSAELATSDASGVTATMSTTVPNGGNGHNLGSMVMLCFAMLATAGALLLLFLGVRRMPRVWAHRPTAPTNITGWVTARLGTGPPPVWEYSVIRC